MENDKFEETPAKKPRRRKPHKRHPKDLRIQDAIVEAHEELAEQAVVLETRPAAPRGAGKAAEAVPAQSAQDTAQAVGKVADVQAAHERLAPQVTAHEQILDEQSAGGQPADSPIERTAPQQEIPAAPPAKRKKRRPNKTEPKRDANREEADYLPRSREILVSAAKDETRVAVVEDGAVVEFYLERPSSQKIAGSIFLGKVMNVLPGMQAAFVDIGEEKNAFLYVDDAILPPNLEDSDGVPEMKGHRKKTITELVKPGQQIMVQVVKEAIGTKGARVTRHVTFPGRYLVLMPTVSYVGVSRRITNDEERRRLRQIARELKPDDMGIIIRTVAENKTREELERDLGFLLRVWEKVQKRAASSKAPAEIHSDLGLVFRTVRDEFNQETTRMLVDDAATYSKVLDLLDTVSPEMKERVIYYRDREYPLFQLYGVDAAVEKALQRQVWLKSGGYLVIDKTEALTVIDVNTGRFVGSKNLADTVFKINMEACAEIARQLRIRDIGGIIVVDFIDMEIPEHRQRLLQEMEKQLKRDHTKTVVVGLTGLGLVEMTRKKVRQSIDAVMMRTCPYCGGKGTVLSEETVASRVRREIRRILRNSQSEAILVEVHPDVASHLIGPAGANLRDLEKETGRSIFVRGNESLHIEELDVRAVGTKEEIAQKAIPVQPGDIIEVTIEEPHDKNPDDGIARREGFVIDVEGAGNKVGRKVVVQVTHSYRTYAKARVVEASEGPSASSQARSLTPF